MSETANNHWKVLCPPENDCGKAINVLIGHMRPLLQKTYTSAIDRQGAKRLKRSYSSVFIDEEVGEKRLALFGSIQMQLRNVFRTIPVQVMIPEHVIIESINGIMNDGIRSTVADLLIYDFIVDAQRIAAKRQAQSDELDERDILQQSGHTVTMEDVRTFHMHIRNGTIPTSADEEG